MKISKIFAGMSALAIAATMAIPAFADTTFTNDTGLDYIEVKEGNQLYVDLAASPYDPATVSAVKISFNIDDSDGFGGGLMLNSNKSGWDQNDTDWSWGNEGAEKAITAEGSDGAYTLTFDFGAKGEEYWGAPTDEKYFAQVVCQLWWGKDASITGIEITGEEKAAAPESQPESKADESSNNSSESKAAESSSKAAETASSKAAVNNNTTTTASSAAAASDNTNQATGATAGLALAGLALAGAVAVVSKKKN